jgi:hypothetical protein|nr:MAG TPA: hypothetical protein [Caudoviricetes sp.]
MTSSKRDSFVYHLSWEEVMDNLPEEVREEVRGGIIGYARTGVTPELKPLAKVAFEFVKRDLDRDFQRYQDMVASRSESGKKGAAAKQANASNAKQSQAKQANASNAKQSQQEEANEADYDNDYDYVTHSVCVNSAQARASTPPAPHTDFDYFFPTFWKANIFQPAAETQRFIDYYEASGWALEKGDLLDSDAKRLAKARIWKPKKEGSRFPPRFAEIWSELAEQAPDNIRRQMYEDGVAVHMESRSVCTSIEVTREVKQWLIDSSNAAARELILGKWLRGNKNKPVQFPVYD